LNFLFNDGIVVKNNSDIPEGYKVTELGLLPEEWQIKSLGDISKIRGGYGFSPDYQGNLKEKIPFFKVSDMNSFGNETAMTSSNNYVGEEVVTKIRAKTFPKNTIIFPKVGAAVYTNKKRILVTDSLIDNNLMGVTSSSEDICSPYFLLFYFLTLDLKDIANPGPLPSINAQRVKSLRIPLPPLPEQHAIATTLRTVQEAKENTDAVIAATKALKAAMMKHLFMYGMVPPEEAERVPLKETEIGSVPEGWEVEKFSEVVDIAKGQIDPTKEPYSKLLHIGPENIVSGTGQVIRIKTAEEINLISGQFYFTSEHVIYSKIRPYLKKVAFPKIEGTCSADMYPLKPKDARLFSEFLFQYLLSDRFSDDAISFQDRTGIPKINRQQIGMIHLPIPPLIIQKQIAALLNAIDQKLASEQSSKEALDTLFTSLLHDLMTAKIRVNQAKTA
jgi:type I restriction enzyme S subunit